MRSVDILSNDSIYAEMLCQELRSEGYNANIGRSSAPDLIIADLDSVDLAQGFPTLSFSYEGPCDLIRPFDIEELIQAVKQRLGEETPSPLKAAQRLYLSPYGRYAVYGEERIDFSELEFALLHLLFDKKGEIISSSVISDEVFGTEDNPNLVRVYISYLRSKLDDRFSVKLIETVRGKGYRLRGDDIE